MVNWRGAEGMDEFDSRIDDLTKTKGLGHIPGMIKKGRGGINLISEAQFSKVEPLLLTEAWKLYMPTEAKMLEELTDEVRTALSSYRDLVTKFRGEIKNDIASAKSAAETIEDNVRRLGKSYRETSGLLTSQEFTTAIHNAERMAAALKALSELQSHSITFAVLDKKA